MFLLHPGSVNQRRQKTSGLTVRWCGPLQALSSSRSLEHVALVTGLKHYLGPSEAMRKGRARHAVS